MDKKKAEFLHIDFENLETVTIPFSDVAFLEGGGAKDNIFAADGKIFQHIKVVEEFLLILLPSAKQHAISSFDMDDVPKTDVFDRLTIYSDIVGFCIQYDDDSKDNFGVPWKENETNPQNNDYQSSFYQQNCNFRGYGGLCVHIGEKDSYPSLRKVVMEDGSDSCDAVENETAINNENDISEEKSEIIPNNDVDKLLKLVNDVFTIISKVSTIDNKVVIDLPFVQHNGDVISVTVGFVKDNNNKIFISDGGEVVNEYRLAGFKDELTTKAFRDFIITKGFELQFDLDDFSAVQNNMASIYTEVPERDAKLVSFKFWQLVQLQIVLFAQLEELRSKTND